MVVCPVISFPHGSATAEVKIFEARRAVEEGGKEIEMVVNIGRVLSGKWEYVKNEIRLVNEAVVDAGAILTVVFETQCNLSVSYLKCSSELMRVDLSEGQIIKLCGICSEVGVAYVQTSVGYAQLNGVYSSKEASSPYLHLIKKHITPRVKIKVSQGVQTLDDLLRARALGVSRVATVGMYSYCQTMLMAHISRALRLPLRALAVVSREVGGNISLLSTFTDSEIQYSDYCYSRRSLEERDRKGANRASASWFIRRASLR